MEASRLPFGARSTHTPRPHTQTCPPASAATPPSLVLFSAPWLGCGATHRGLRRRPTCPFAGWRTSRWVTDCRGQETEELEHGVGVFREEAGPCCASYAGARAATCPSSRAPTSSGSAVTPTSPTGPWCRGATCESSGRKLAPPRACRAAARWCRGRKAQGRGAVRVPTEMEATRSLVCAGADASDAQVRRMASHCTFYRQGELKPDATDYFSEKGEEGRFTPYLAVCANPARRTIAFVFQCTWWI